MSKLITLFLLLVPLVASAECGFANDGSTMTIVVGKSSNKCFESEAFRTAFKEGVASALAADEARTGDGKNSFDDRSARGAKLWTIAERRFQATRPAGRYYGMVR
ncbi:MAG TPA: hypothetical protein VJ698_00445 [Noviherbaspirillum sp.]|uniref:hypothetical protein n=1 Tax=Noviherbaspirillum sp. TaxID=1926288 RepID=UPI002B47A4CE|nr:hypothetical protein [Noviherbaspirillum sp.]HJV83914.1 hypothetical protein [Noviherbaspirillum sp.]